MRHLAGNHCEIHNAGVELSHVQPLAIRAMAEAGIDISGHQSKTLDRYLSQTWDYVITVCDDANASCPVFSGGRRRLHWSFLDPSKAAGSEDEMPAAYRQVRDAIRARIEAVVESEDEVPRQDILGGEG